MDALSPPCFAAPSLSIGLNFLGSSYETNSQALPPDANGAIGPQHFVELINGSFAVYDKTTGENILRLSDVDFWGGAGITVASDQAITDPRMIYDPLSQRWFASMVDFDANANDPTTEANDFLIAFSDTSDPTGNWTGFKIRADPTHGDFADFPTLGVDSNAVYISGNMFKGEENDIGPNLLSFPKADLLNSNITTRTYFGVLNPTNYGWVLQPATCFDASTNGTILSMGDIGFDDDLHSNLVTFHVLGAGTAHATLSTPVQIIVDPYSTPLDPNLEIPQFTATQPDGTQNLQANDPRFAAKVYNVGGVLYGAHNTEFNNRIAIQWYRIDAASGTLLEQGMMSDADLDLFFPSIAANPAGTVVIGCNGSSIDTLITSFVYAGQTVSGVTTFGDRTLLQAGSVSYHDLNDVLGQLLGEPTDSRWGDYSATSVDPTDPTQIWTIQMIPTDVDNSDQTGFGQGIWSTWITQLQILSLPQLTIAPAGANVLISWPVSAANFQLQSNTNLASANWLTITPPLSTNGSVISAVVPLSGPQDFFRLKQ
ncbi:MAG TPA: hypothetical protein VKV04_10240 [Verrucomicrobiae bacterium]|nr:hypothetical protein [Verrucomicrobiae bacterium]